MLHYSVKLFQEKFFSTDQQIVTIQRPTYKLIPFYNPPSPRPWLQGVQTLCVWGIIKECGWMTIKLKAFLRKGEGKIKKKPTEIEKEIFKLDIFGFILFIVI